MKLGEIIDLVDGKALSADFDPELEVQGAFAADLMSDVLTYAQECGLLLTGLPNPLVVRTAEVAGMQAIIFVRGKQPAPETIDLAADKGIGLATTRLTMFEACGRLYCAGVESMDVRGEARRSIDEKLQASGGRRPSSKQA